MKKQFAVLVLSSGLIAMSASYAVAQDDSMAKPKDQTQTAPNTANPDQSNGDKMGQGNMGNGQMGPGDMGPGKMGPKSSPCKTGPCKKHKGHSKNMKTQKAPDAKATPDAQKTPDKMNMGGKPMPPQ